MDLGAPAMGNLQDPVVTHLRALRLEFCGLWGSGFSSVIVV